MPKVNKTKTKKRTWIQWIIARLICVMHLSLSVVFYRLSDFAPDLFFVPIIGIGLVIVETVFLICFKFRFHYSSILLLIYSVTIILSIWLLEIYKINQLVDSENQRASVEVFSTIYYATNEPRDKFFLTKKYILAQIQIQIYVFFIVFVKGLCEEKGHKRNTIVKTWGTALDTLDFINLLIHPKLYADRVFVYTTLSIWSISCLQFVIDMSLIGNILRKKNHQRLAAIMTDATLSMLIMDVPYLCVRLYAIFGVRKHDYTSYFLVLKNIFTIILTTTEIRKNLHERSI